MFFIQQRQCEENVGRQELHLRRYQKDIEQHVSTVKLGG